MISKWLPARDDEPPLWHMVRIRVRDMSHRFGIWLLAGWWVVEWCTEIERKCDCSCVVLRFASVLVCVSVLGFVFVLGFVLVLGFVFAFSVRFVFVLGFVFCVTVTWSAMSGTS